MQKIIVVFIFSFFSCACVVSCADAPDTPAPARAADTVAYDTVTARLPPDLGTLQTSATLVPNERFIIVSKVNGVVRKVFVEANQQVTNEQTLATIDASDISAQLAAANNEARIAASKVQQSKLDYNTLLASRTTSAARLQKARVQMNAAMQAYKGALAVRRTYLATGGSLMIRSPFRGIVVAKNVATGDSIQNDGKTLFELEDHQMLRLQVPVPEAYADVEISDIQATFTVPAFGGNTFNARYAGRFIDADSIKNELWVFEADNTNRRFKTGMTAHMQLSLAAPSVGVLLPNTALMTVDNKTYVIRVRENRVSWVEVKRGTGNEQETEVLGPVTAGEVFVRSATSAIEDGSAIAIK